MTHSTQAELDAAAPKLLAAGERTLHLTPVEPLDIERVMRRHRTDTLSEAGVPDRVLSALEATFRSLEPLKLVTVSGQVGPDARPLHPDWVREIIRQCEAAGVEVVFSSWGEWAPREVLARGLDEAPDLNAICWWDKHEGWVPGITSDKVQYMVHVGPEASGRVLDGKTWEG